MMFTPVHKMANKKDMEVSEDEQTASRDLERLKAQLQQEDQMREMLDQSVAELKLTVEQLESRYDNVNDEGNEWKTRFETQEELNQLLQKQIDLLKEKLDKAKESAKEGYETDMKSYDELSEASLRKMLKQLEREKASMEGQLRDFEWRLDQESKAFHRAHDERRNLLTELTQAKLKLDEIKHANRKSRTNPTSPRNPVTPRIPVTPRNQQDTSASISTSQTSPRYSGRNVPDNQRILDPRKGPIKKTAAVKKLPKLDASSSPSSLAGTPDSHHSR